MSACPCGRPLQPLTENQSLGCQVFGLCAETLTPDGPGRLLAAGADHRRATHQTLCGACAGLIFQPAWLPLSPRVERAQAFVDASRTRIR